MSISDRAIRSEITCQFQITTSLSPITNHSVALMISGNARGDAPGSGPKSSWNPYSRVKEIPIAVISEVSRGF
jgi:hypothetical protein